DVLPPHDNASYHDFAVSEGNIRYGLLAIKNLGRAFIGEIIRGRVSGAYRSFYDFCKRLYGKNMNSRALESLIRCGALDGLGANRRQMLAIVKDVLADLEYTARRNMSGQLSFFDMGESAGQTAEPELPPLEEFPRDELLRMENETAGIYFSGHPLDDYTAFAKLVQADRIGAILSNEGGAYPDGKLVCLVGVVTHVKTQLTKSQKTMARITVEDRYGSMEAVVFPNVYERFGFYLGEAMVVIVRGTLNFRENEDPKLICEFAEKARTNEECRQHQAAVSRPQQPAPRPSQPQALYLRIDDLHTPLYERARRVLDIFDGSTPVVFYLTDSHRKVRAPASLWVSLNDVMLRELRYQLGDDNVAVR
ncbi:MAG: DNA polymerase III subunit alpha, partial [Ruminococcus sp.]|nr:DNA polymerase III subunit alpha [Ruminococcus sp.]